MQAVTSPQAANEQGGKRTSFQYPENPNRLISSGEFQHLLGCGNTKFHELRADPESGMPRAISIGRSKRYRLGEAEAFIEMLAAKRDQAVSA